VRWGRKKSPQTWGDSIRARTRAAGALYSIDEEAFHREVLTELLGEERKAFAAAAAERLMRKHEALPPDEQMPFTMGWRPTLDAIWRGIADDQTAFAQVSRALSNLYVSPQWHNEGPDGPDELNEDAAAAVVYTAECFIHGCVDSAVWAAQRELEAAHTAVELSEFDGGTRSIGPDDAARWALSEPVQAVLRRQRDDLAYLQSHGSDLRGPPASAGAVANHLRG
jgi:plasmid stability protein